LKTNKHIDVKLIEAYNAGDKNALAQLVKRWHVIFCKKAYWIVKDADLSKDIAQESWRTIIDKLDKLENSSSFGSWSKQIVYSKSLDALRKRNRELLKQKEFKYEQSVYDEIYNENTQLKEDLLKAILSLTIEQQVTIKLFYKEAYSLKEISDMLNLSIGTVKSRLFHAREKLKQILKANNRQ